MRGYRRQVCIATAVGSWKASTLQLTSTPNIISNCAQCHFTKRGRNSGEFKGNSAYIFDEDDQRQISPHVLLKQSKALTIYQIWRQRRLSTGFYGYLNDLAFDADRQIKIHRIVHQRRSRPQQPGTSTLRHESY